MCALNSSPAVRPIAGGVPRRAATATSVVPGKKRPAAQEDVPSVKRRKQISMRLVKLSEESKDDEKLAVAEESKDDKVDAEESKGKVVREHKGEEYADISGGLSFSVEAPGSKPSSSCSGDSERKVQVQQSSEAKNAQQRAAPKAVDMRALLYKAKLRRQQLEMERAALPDQSIHPRDLQRLGIAEYGHSLKRRLGLVDS